MQSIRLTQKKELQNEELYPINYMKIFNKYKKNKRKFRKQMYKINKKYEEKGNSKIKNQTTITDVSVVTV